MSDIERFWTFVDTTSTPTGCWTWTRSLSNGYGQFVRTGRVKVRAHRWLLGVLRGRALDPTEMACHHCDNRACVRPEHLYIGDATTNINDAVDRLRHWQSSKTHCPAGHQYTPENTYRASDKGRDCRACLLPKQRARYAAHREEILSRRRARRAATRV